MAKATPRDFPGVPGERIANKAELARWFEISLPTVDSWIRTGCPFLQRGSSGNPWVFDLLSVSQWKYSGNRDETGIDPESMSRKDRLDHYRGNVEQRKDALDAGQVIWKDEAQDAMAEQLKIMALSLETLTEKIGRRAKLSPQQAAEIELEIDEMRRALYIKLKSIAEENAVEAAAA